MTKIYTAMCRPWFPEYAWFGRDAGLVTEGLLQAGAESRLVIIASPGMPDDARFLPANREQFHDPVFWRELGADAVVLQDGGTAAAEPVADAIQAAGSKVFLRMDSDGVIAPQVDPYLYTYTRWWWLKHNRKRPAMLRALGTSLLKLAMPARYGPGRIARRLARGDAILVESSIAASRLRRLLCTAGAPEAAAKVVRAPIPVPEDRSYGPEDGPKKNLIVAAGRWRDPQKDAPKLVKVLGATLARHPGYAAVVLGDGADKIRALVGKHAPNVAGRIDIAGRVPHQKISATEREAKIFLCSSRAESMSIATAEALCCGCSVVGPAEIAAMHDYVARESGTLAWTRRARDLDDAVSAEIDAWTRGERDPVAISRNFRDRFAPRSVAASLLTLLEAGPQPRIP